MNKGIPRAGHFHGGGAGRCSGVVAQPLEKMGWLCSDTAQLRFDGVRVPVPNLVGEEGTGSRSS